MCSRSFRLKKLKTEAKAKEAALARKIQQEQEKGNTSLQLVSLGDLTGRKHIRGPRKAKSSGDGKSKKSMWSKQKKKNKQKKNKKDADEDGGAVVEENGQVTFQNPLELSASDDDDEGDLSDE